MKLEDVSILLTGDINAVEEAKLLQEHRAGQLDLRAEVLKVPHHGSDDVDVDFLEAVRPLVSIISAGDEDGIVHVHHATCGRTGRLKEVKTGEARRVPIEPELLPLLKIMHDEAEGGGRVAPLRGINDNLARTLRHFLRVAGVKREELFVQGDRTRKAITYYDLRATGVTWMALRGDNPMAIKQRAGHRRFETTEGYIREAENLRAASAGEPFPPLPACLLGSGQVLAKVPLAGLSKPKPRAWLAERAGFEPAAGF